MFAKLRKKVDSAVSGQCIFVCDGSRTLRCQRTLGESNMSKLSDELGGARHW